MDLAAPLLVLELLVVVVILVKIMVVFAGEHLFKNANVAIHILPLIWVQIVIKLVQLQE